MDNIVLSPAENTELERDRQYRIGILNDKVTLFTKIYRFAWLMLIILLIFFVINSKHC